MSPPRRWLGISTPASLTKQAHLNVNTESTKRNHAEQFESLGYRVTIEPAAEQLSTHLAPPDAAACLVKVIFGLVGAP